MKFHILPLMLMIHIHMGIADDEIYKESIPTCGRAFLFTNQFPNYYEKKLIRPYQSVKDKDPKVVWDVIYTIVMDDSRTIGQNRFYFKRCVSKKGNEKDEENLQKYAKCRLRLTPEMSEVASKNLASYLPDTVKGLEKASAALEKTFGQTTRVKWFKSCLEK